jgi:hypothetical protein
LSTGLGLFLLRLVPTARLCGFGPGGLHRHAGAAGKPASNRIRASAEVFDWLIVQFFAFS